MEKSINKRLSRNQTKDLRFIGSLISNGESSDTIQNNWSNFVTNEWNTIKGLNKDIPIDINALVQMVLREAYLENSEDLAVYAKKVEYFNEKKKKIQEHINEIRTTSENYIKTLEEQLSTIGDDCQMSQMKLQNKLQELQQAMQMISNIMKNMHDTAMAIIRNLR